MEKFRRWLLNFHLAQAEARYATLLNSGDSATDYASFESRRGDLKQEIAQLRKALDDGEPAAASNGLLATPVVDGRLHTDQN
jgi:hypothetical protein